MENFEFENCTLYSRFYGTISTIIMFDCEHDIDYRLPAECTDLWFKYSKIVSGLVRTNSRTL